MLRAVVDERRYSAAVVSERATGVVVGDQCLGDLRDKAYPGLTDAACEGGANRVVGNRQAAAGRVLRWRLGECWRRWDGGGPFADPVEARRSSPRHAGCGSLSWWDRELAAGDIAAEFDVTWLAISQHLTVLKTAGLVIERREGVSRKYRADKVALGPLRAVVEDHWRSSLNRMKDLAEAEQQERNCS